MASLADRKDEGSPNQGGRRATIPSRLPQIGKPAPMRSLSAPSTPIENRPHAESLPHKKTRTIRSMAMDKGSRERNVERVQEDTFNDQIAEYQDMNVAGVKPPETLGLPVVSHGAEFLAQGYLMRRNILTYKAPPNNEGYDLICIHPDPHKVTRQIRIQVKSRYATNADRGFPVKERTFTAFDFLIAVFLNIGTFGGKSECRAGLREPEFYTLPVDFIKRHHNKSSSWEKVRLRSPDIEQYKNEKGFEQIADALGVDYPARR